MSAVTRLGHVAVWVSDLERSCGFYCDVLGLVVSDMTELDDHPEIRRGAWLRTPSDSDHHCLAIFETKASAGQNDDARAPSGMHHFAFAVGSYDDLLRGYRALRAAGIEIVGQRRYGPGSQVRLYCLDPDGHRVELYWDLDQIGWDGLARPFFPLEDIDLEDHDVDQYLATKEQSRADARAALETAMPWTTRAEDTE